eukprot:COSAG02_NODE_1164_length_14157_cov_2.925096_6_plen_761_part_00
MRQATVIDEHRPGVTVDKGRLTFTESTWSERLRFMVDDFLSSTTYPRLAILGTSTGVLLGLATLSFWRLSGVKMAPREAVWVAWTTIADPGTHTLTPTGQGRMRSVGVVFTLGGLFFFALLIGLVNDGISSYLDELEGGRTKAVVSNHVVVAGFSHKLKTVLEEFGKADRDGRSGDEAEQAEVFVVLTDRPKEDIIELLGPDVTKDGLKNGARVLVRTADPSDPAGLLIASPNTASSVVLLSPGDKKDDNEADAMVMARVMALLSLDVRAPVVAEIRDKDNLAAVHELIRKQQQQQQQRWRRRQWLTEGQAPQSEAVRSGKHLLLAHQRPHVLPCAGEDIVGNVMVQAALQPGLSKVIHHLLDYAEGQGNEVYITSLDAWPQLQNRTFAEVSFMCDGAVVLGVLTHREQKLDAQSFDSSHEESCPMVLNPPDDFIVKPGDQLCVVAQDKTPQAFKVREAPARLRTALSMPESKRLSERKPNQQLLICNWRDDMEDVLHALDKRAGPGAVLTIVSHLSIEERHRMLDEGGGLKKLRNLRIKHLTYNTVKKRHLERVLLSAESPAYDAVLVFSDDIEGSNDFDARAVVCSMLVHSMRAQREQSGRTDDSITTEIKDRQSLQLLRVAGISHFVISDELTSMMTVHLARNPSLRHFWIDNVFSSGTSEFAIVPVNRCVDCTSIVDWVDSTTHILLNIPKAAVGAMTFWDLLAACRLRGCTPIAVKRHGDDEINKWIFNPPEKDKALGLRPEDMVLVLAPKERLE